METSLNSSLLILDVIAFRLLVNGVKDKLMWLLGVVDRDRRFTAENAKFRGVSDGARDNDDACWWWCCFSEDIEIK